jgi:hypothetical protein
MNRFKGFCTKVAEGLAIALIMAGPALADVYTDADTALDTAVAAIGPLLIVGLGIPLAFLGFRVVKRIIRAV